MTFQHKMVLLKILEPFFLWSKDCK